MKHSLLLTFGLGFGVLCAASAADNLIRHGDFASLEGWKRNEHLAKAGKVTPRPAEKAVTLANPVIDRDGSLYQDVATDGHPWIGWSVRIKAGTMMRASLGLVALDAGGRVLDIDTPTKIQGMRWVAHEGTMRMPPGTATLRVLLTVLDGDCSFGEVKVWKSEAPVRVAPRTRLSPGSGFAVRELAVERPFWELFCADLDGDGRGEIVGCDVDGEVTVRQEGEAPFLRFAAGALVYQFAAADLDGDGVKEILLSSVDPKIAVRGINLKGATVRTFAGSRGPERLAVGDAEGDGRPEVAVSIDNNKAGSGVAAGVVVYDRDGGTRWKSERLLRTFAWADWVRGGGQELLIGGPNGEFTVHHATGELVRSFSVKGGLLEQFEVKDLEGDGTPEIVALSSFGPRATLQCHDGVKLRWETPVTVSLRNTGTGGGGVLACGDFDPKVAGLETVIVSLHVVTVVDATGVLVYQSRDGREGETWEMWAPGGINSLGLAYGGGREPVLYLSSSRLRHPAYYRIDYGRPDELKAYRVPDQEKHLEALQAAVKAQPAWPAQTNEKVKVFMALSEFARVPEATLREYGAALKALETPALEYLVMYEASDLLGHERGQKLTTEQIVARARLFEKVGIPFGYFATHGGQVWITREAIQRSKEAAPKMFRFLYIAENLETLYSPLYKDVLKWTDEALDFCAAHGMKMIFKEKHDVWGLLPSDPEVFNVLFSPKHREVTVPIWSTNQPYQPEIQLGGMLGLKAAGLCREFGMSTQYWNWHEWGKYPRGIRDISPTFVCPSDIILRLELTGVALGGTWVHVEGGQTYLWSDPRKGVIPLANRHRELVYELVRKNFLVPGAGPANVNAATVVRSFHPALEDGKAKGRKVAYPYYERNFEALRQGFIPARYLFETYAPEAFPRLAYGEDWNVRSCFPQTPFGWVPVLPPDAGLRSGALVIQTDGERVRLAGEWQSAAAAAPAVAGVIAQGAAAIPLQAPGACVILQRDGNTRGRYVAVLIDPGYLAPIGVNTTLVARQGAIRRVTDLVSGRVVPLAGSGCPVQIEPGAFRILQVELSD
jgi:hypothetical protein